MLDEFSSRRWKQEHKFSPGELLKMLRNRAGLTQAQLAELLGFSSPRMVRSWEGEFYLPTAERLQRLIEIYLQRQVFVSGEEREEAELLWKLVKNRFEALPGKFETYPIFDERWFTAWQNKFGNKGDQPPALPLKKRAKAPTRLPGELPPRKHNLTASLDNFIGRQDDLNRLVEMLAGEKPNRRLVTLCGTGGVGKTRLAFEVATKLAEADYFSDGVWWVELAPLNDPLLIAQTIATTLELKEKVGAAREKNQLEGLLVEYLQDKQLLLALDNCEHLIGECAYLAQMLLKNCAGLQLLVTSREILNLWAETQYLLGGLSLPGVSLTVTAHQPNQIMTLVEKSEAAQLFIERASRRQPDFPHLVSQDLPTAQAVLQICRQLDGLPLALELAAARIPVLAVSQIVEHLDDRFRLLTGGDRTAVPRQQTLKATLDWSYQLLSQAEQSLFQRLAVFAGGWSLEAAQEICLANSPADWQALELLTQLVNKSLVVIEIGSAQPATDTSDWKNHLEPQQYRYCYLDTLREYALTQLQANLSATELTTLYEQYTRYYLALARQAEPFFRTGQQKNWLKRLNLELANLRLALEWCKQVGPTNSAGLELGLELAGTLWRYWQASGYFKEGLTQLKNLQELAEEAGLQTSPVFLTVLNARALLYRNTGSYLEAQALANQVLELATNLAEAAQEALARYILGSILTRQGHFVEAYQHYEQSLALYRQLGDLRGIGSVVYSLSTAAFSQGDYTLAAQSGQEALEIFQKLEDLEGIGQAQIILGNQAYASGNYVVARSHYLASLQSLQEAGQKRSMAYTINNLGIIAALLNEYEAASQYFRQCIELARELGDKQGELYGLISSGQMSLLQNDLATARHYVEQSLSLARQIGDQRLLANGLELAGWIDIEEQHYAQAQLYLLETLQLRQPLGNRTEYSLVLNGLMKLAWEAGKSRLAVTLAGFMTVSLEQAVQPLVHYEEAIYQEVTTEGRLRLALRDFEFAFELGNQMSLEQLINFVMTEFPLTL